MACVFCKCTVYWNKKQWLDLLSQTVPQGVICYNGVYAMLASAPGSNVSKHDWKDYVCPSVKSVAKQNKWRKSVK